MMRGFLELAWVELKIFAREPLGVLATVGVPILAFLLLGRSVGDRALQSERLARVASLDLPILACLLIVLSAATSLIAIVSIYRESGILKRLRATPLRPLTILSVHVALKLALSAFTLILLVLLGKRFYPVEIQVPLASFLPALLLATASILSIGFVIASVVPTARFAQPVAGAVLYPLLAISGLFVPVESLSPVWRLPSLISPITWAVSLLSAIWSGESWSGQLPAVAALLVNLVICSALSAKLFRWE